MEEKTVSLSLSTILRECSLRQEACLDHFFYFMLRNRENVHEIFRYQKFNDDFVSKLDCFNDGQNIIGWIRPSYDEYLRRITYLLNVPIKGKIIDDDVLTQKLSERVKLLQNISSEIELKKEFPLIYQDLIDGRNYYRDLENMKRLDPGNSDEYNAGEKYYYRCGLRRSLDNFVKTQAEVYSRFVEKRKEFQKQLQQTSFNRYLSRNFDMDKFYMYVMHEYLVKAEGCQNRVEIQKYISFIEQYLASDRNQDVTITTDSGMKVDIQNIRNRFHNLKRILSDDSSQVEWVLIPSGRDYTRVKKDSGMITSSVTMNMDEYIKLREKGERKRAFYEGTPYLARVIGLKMYRGYIGYIYENGEVILDTEYDENRPFTVQGNAVYNLKVADFETLSQYDKFHLRRHPNVGVINHSKTWEKRVSKIIERDATPEESSASKQLVKRLKERNESN